jgi:hypothetical protein
MKVNKTTLNIEDFGTIDKNKLKIEIDKLVYNGNISGYIREIFLEWMSQTGLNPNQELLIISTVFPMRVYSSLLNSYYLLIV